MDSPRGAAIEVLVNQMKDARVGEGLSLLHEFYEEQPSGHRSAWHRQQLRIIYRMWGLQTPLEATLSRKGEEALDEWVVSDEELIEGASFGPKFGAFTYWSCAGLRVEWGKNRMLSN